MSNNILCRLLLLLVLRLFIFHIVIYTIIPCATSAYNNANKIKAQRHYFQKSAEMSTVKDLLQPTHSRRSVLTGTLAALLSVGTVPVPVFATQSDTSVISLENFSFSIPSNWNIITKPKPNEKKQQTTLFSAIDFQSGSVLTVVQEQACSAQEYAQSPTTCDFVLPSTGIELLSDDTLSKDLSKLIIRHDDRDNAALQGTTTLDSFSVLGNKKNNVVDIIATTTIPSGGTYRDTMGIERLNTIDRNLKAKAVVAHGATKIISLWLSAPSDEWQKPVMGTKLNQIWGSIKYE